MGTAIKHPVPDRVKPSFVIFDFLALWRSGLSVRVPKWRLNPVWQRMLYSCTHMATVGFKGLNRTALSSQWMKLADMRHLTCGISSLLHSVNFILFTVLLAHLILRISPHHSHHLRSNHLSLPRPFTPDLKLISFTNPFLHSHSYSFRADFRDLNLYCIKGALALFVLVSVLATCAR